MSADSDPPLELIFSFFQGLHRKAPGSVATTRKALSLLPGLPAEAGTVDFGCGSGASALVLAEAGLHVTAVDIHVPFLETLTASAAAAGLADRIRVEPADMAAPPFPPASFDVVWSEGAIYLIGFERGLRLWRPLLRPTGCLAVTEVSWLVADPPREAADVWAAEYPAITTIAQNLDTVRLSGYEPIDHFVLPPDDWNGYYGPLQEQLGHFRRQYLNDEDGMAFVASMQREIDLWKKYGDSYGYVFFLARPRM